MSHPIQSLLADAKNYGDRHASSPPPKPPQPSYKLHKPDDEVQFLEKEYSLTEIANNECNKNNKSPGRSTFSAKKVFLNKSSSAKVDNDDDDGDNDDDHAENDDDENGELVVVEVHNNKVLDRSMPSSPDQTANNKVGDHCNDANINGQYEVCSPSSINSDKSDKVLEHDVADKEKCQVTVGTVSSNESLDVNKSRNDKQSVVETEATAIKSDQTPSPTTSSPHTAPTSTSELLSSTAFPVKTGSAIDESEGAASVSSGRISTFVPPSRILFKVEATHKYVGEDIDELSFDIGDIITVVPFDNPDDQDDGWLMGIIEKSKEKGVFPQNFTKMIQ
ncbi:hypothetical protein HELRODRAFT_160396 [Helobdella robusta]|uniref:SH3 domain-containing protein n=1 Tax=Helobdella robusta TaxID=6412 RepID=T1EQ73_HELRO|nr:hypothetical protein HELRODRAFT_160396 [Helobdella robusta]ESO06238.1 hypothetical protein HELRODRAFT_160396 [Helobdella robusta]